MDIYKLKFTRLQNEILRFLSIKSGEDLNQREISRNLKVSPTAVAKALPLLGKEDLVKLKKGKTNLNVIQFNRDSEKAITFKRIENLKLIYESGLVNFLENNFPGSLIILFGSYSKGEDTTKSDIDLAIISAKEREVNLTEFEKKLGREIRINFYDSLVGIHKNLRNNILNGIVLVGVVEL